MPIPRIPNPVALPEPVYIPSMPLSMPRADIPTWTSIPIYREDIKDLKSKGAKEGSKKEDVQEKENEKNKKADKEKVENGELELDIVTPDIALPPISIPQVPQFKEVNVIEVPFLGEIPIPRAEILVTATTTAGAAAAASVAATLVASSAFGHIMKVLKPSLKFVFQKLLKKENKFTRSWARQRLMESHQRK
tara:strand:- start:137 stop:712 length:576 start_codon:yes stop_codon:yes gene_type:complete